MTNQPAANGPADHEPTERDTAADNATGNETATADETADEAAPRYEADYLGGELPPDDTEDTVKEPTPTFAEYDAEPPYREKTAAQAPPASAS